MQGDSLKLELRIDWGEIDVFGHINNLAILKYVQAGRVNFLDAVGLMQSQAEKKIGPILAAMNCQFRRPLFYPGQVTVYSRGAEIKNTSFRIQHTVYNDRGQVAAEVQDILVLFDFRKGKKLAIPGDLRDKIECLRVPDRKRAPKTRPASRKHGNGQKAR